MALILLLPSRRPALSALAFVAGAYTVVFAVGTGLFLGASTLGQEIAGGTVWVRGGALLLAAVILVVLGARRLRTRHRGPVQLPDWFGPWTAAPLGVLATGADLPNAFPFFVAIERLAAAQVPTGTGFTVLALYALIYCLPCLLLLATGVIWRERIATRLQRVYQRFGSGGPRPRSIPMALGLWLLAAAVAAVAVSLRRPLAIGGSPVAAFGPDGMMTVARCMAQGSSENRQCPPRVTWARASSISACRPISECSGSAAFLASPR